MGWARTRKDSMSQYVIGVDIGGTKIAAGIVDEKGGIVAKTVVSTLAEEGFETSLEQVYKSVEELKASGKAGWEEIKGIGVCAPGPLDPFKGVVHNPPNLPGWREVPLAELVSEKFDKPVRLENDANAAGMAEVKWGAAKGYKHVFYVTVSTGIGTAVIIDGKIYHGKNGMAGEGGHVTINYDAKDAVCNCGNTGCVETLASGPGTVRRLLAKLKNAPDEKKAMILAAGEKDDARVTMITVGKAAANGNKTALEAINEEAKLLGIWLGSMISVLDPEIIVIGGGVSMLGELLLATVRKTIPAYTINTRADKTPVVQAKLKNDVGIFGAAAVSPK